MTKTEIITSICEAISELEAAADRVRDSRGPINGMDQVRLARETLLRLEIMWEG